MRCDLARTFPEMTDGLSPEEGIDSNARLVRCHAFPMQLELPARSHKLLKSPTDLISETLFVSYSRRKRLTCILERRVSANDKS